MSMTIGSVLTRLRSMGQDKRVYFDFCRCVPTEVGSWRGVYAEPALGWAPSGYSGNAQAPTVAELIGRLEEAIDGRTFGGWKSGDYSYGLRHTLHIDNAGDWTQTEIASVEQDEYQVMIYTIHEDTV
jgi:hypothetical protein